MKTAQKNPHLNRNIGIVVAVIVILLVAIVASFYIGLFNTGGSSSIPTPSPQITPISTPTPTPTPIPLDFNVSLGQSRGTYEQGSNILDTVYVTWLGGNRENVTLSGDGGSSGIQCSFDPTTNTPDFTSTLTMSIPDSTPTNPYSVIVTATAGGVTRTVAYTVSVLSSNISVSGLVIPKDTRNSPSQIRFTDQQMGLTVTGYVSGEVYSVTLQNRHTYHVYCDLKYPSGNVAAFDGGFLYIYVPVGDTTMSRNFSG